MKINQVISACIALIVALATSQSACAALGESVDSIAVDRKSIHAVRLAATPHKDYSVQEVASEATTVREYVSPSGIIFGIAWNGYLHPDLTQLLGSFWGEYTAGQQKAARIFGHKRQQVTTENIVVEKWGHMRNLRGRAYVPGLIPEGVRIDEIK